MNSYWFVSRPEIVEHRHPYLVFDCQDRLHLPLTLFGKDASYRLSHQAVRTYLYAILPFFTWLDTDRWQSRAGVSWDASPKRVRHAVEDYLVQKLECQVQQHQRGFQLVRHTAGTPSTLRGFLAALKLFYQCMIQRERYLFLNPLMDPMSATVAAIESRLDAEDLELNGPRMPAFSGVEKPRGKPERRLTDSYYKLEHADWEPHIIDDPTLPGEILQGGEHLSLRFTRQRDEVVTWLLFESGARVSEVTGLMLGDWTVLGTLNKAKAFSKGSFGRRIKTLSFSNDVTILLKRYFDEERIRFDPQGYTLDDYLHQAKHKMIDLQTIPLFLTTRRTQLTPKEYREHYWQPACQAAGIEVDVHQARHWHVTREVRDIYTTARNRAEIEQRLQSLVTYMKWKSADTLEAYQHYFDDQIDADVRTGLQNRMHEGVLQYLQERRSGKRAGITLTRDEHQECEEQSPSAMLVGDEPTFAFLYSLGGVK